MIEFYEQALAELFIANLRLTVENKALNEVIREDVAKEAAEDAADGVPDEVADPLGPEVNV